MENEIYRNVKTKEFIYKGDAQEFALEELGLKMIPLGEGGSYTLDQLSFLEELEEYFYSGDWVKDIYEEKECSTAELINESCYYDDMWLKNRGEF